MLQIREATAADAEQVLAHLQHVVSHPPVMIPKAPEEISLTLAQEQLFLEQLRAAANSLFLIALDGEQVVGNLDIKGLGRKALAHVGVLGMAIQAAYRGQGLGSQLMQAGLDWAQNSPLKRIELNVYCDNTPAIALYQKFGFVIEGRRKGYVLHEGQYCDDLIMGLWLDK